MSAPRTDKSTSHFHSCLENLSDPQVLDDYRLALKQECPVLESRIRNLYQQVNPFASTSNKLALANAMELDFVNSLLEIAKVKIGKKRVPLLNHGPAVDPSREYIQTRDALLTIYQTLRCDHNLDNTQITETILRLKFRASHPEIALDNTTNGLRTRVLSLPFVV